MDKMVKVNISEVYNKRKILITGHTGFKGSWLALWLHKSGAIVKGYSLPPETNPNHWNLLNLDIESVYGDIRNLEGLRKEIDSFNPDIVFHLAAQPIVRASYDDPISTYQINVLGTLNLFEACKQNKNVAAIINVTSDKCYENKEWIWGYRESDSLGGFDPYSSSKACSELLTSSYRNSYWNLNDFGKKHNTLLASARAGNVIGGGDWAQDRLIPDIMSSAATNGKVLLRNPAATRPWQHVLEPLYGYMMLGAKLLEGEKKYADAWNFGPLPEANRTVLDITNEISKLWDKISVEVNSAEDSPHEANLLMLDSSKALKLLNWKTELSFDKTIEFLTNWYKQYYLNDQLISLDQIRQYEDLMK